MLSHATAQSGAVTLIQRFGSALNLNIHFHLLCLDGVYVQAGDRLQFRRVAAPTPGELQALLQRITARVGRQPERRGLLVRDDEISYLSLEPREESALEGLLGHSITYRIAIGPQAGRKVFTLQTVPASPTPERDNPWLAKAAGFSLHAGVAAGTDQRDKVERLCRYIARPAIASGRLVLTGQGDIRDGTTHVIFQPLDFMVRLAALVPKPRVHLTRYHGVFAPHSRWRTEVTAAKRGAGKSPAEIKSPAERQRAMTWAQRLKRVFRIDIERCARCGGKLKVIASIEDPALIGRILQHREQHSPAPATTAAAHHARGPPQRVLDLS